jgi:BirA family transcriptional regulator, biotin operon repressor / biotin---[acetyl-CoA-carboxylase] ligase
LERTSRLDIEVLRHQLETQFLGVGDRLIYLPVVDSTNSLAMRMADERPDEGVVVLTDSQTQGRGRQGRHWVDVSSYNVLSSTLLRPSFPPHLLVMVASLAVVDSVAETCDVVASIKWPNDILFEDRKVAGILIETSHDVTNRMVAVIGIGINVNGRIQEVVESFPAQAQLLTTATTLEEACGHSVSREILIARLLQHLEVDYLALQEESQQAISSVLVDMYGSPSRRIREQWRSRLSTLGRVVQVRQGDTVVSGIAEDVDGNGELLLRRHSGELVSITWGDVGYPVG